MRQAARADSFRDGAQLPPDFPDQLLKFRGHLLHFTPACAESRAVGFERFDQLKCLVEVRGTSFRHRSLNEAQREQRSSSEGFFLLTAKFREGYRGQSS